jgi:hypothetical protein
LLQIRHVFPLSACVDLTVPYSTSRPRLLPSRLTGAAEISNV